MIAKIVGVTVLVLAAASPGVALAQGWGSIYYSPSSEATGTSYDWPSQEDAELTAANGCGVTDCEYAISFQDACGAVASGDNGGWSGGIGADSTIAQNDALRLCGERDSGCEVVNWECSN